MTRDDGSLDRAEETLGVTFASHRTLRQALVHRSYLNENADFDVGSNERLEFLGDAILGFIVASHLYENHPGLAEGELTRFRAALVRTQTLALVARRLGLGQHIYLSRGEESTGGRSKPRMLASTFEAIVGAIYVDLGMEAARSFIVRTVIPELERFITSGSIVDAKSSLQEILQADVGLPPTYDVVESSGPDHAKRFVVAVSVGERHLANGTGSSKQEAEQSAARAAISSWTRLER